MDLPGGATDKANVTQETQLTYQYDLFNQLIGRDLDGEETVYVNDRGHRVIEFENLGQTDQSINCWPPSRLAMSTGYPSRTA